MLQRYGHGPRQASKLAQRFRDKVPYRKLNSDYFVPGGVLKACSTDVLDASYVQEAVRRVLTSSGISPNKFTFEVYGEAGSFRVYTDIDFKAANDRRRAGGQEPSLTEAFLLTKILDATGDTALAAHYGGDFYTSEATSQVVQVRYDKLLRRTAINQGEVRAFTEVVIDGGRTVKETINGGERTFNEFLTVLDRSERFREWIKGVSPDAKLIPTYVRDVMAEDWINKMPAKVLRYLIASAVDMIEPISGTAASALDAFLVDKMLGGWRPSHFVERDLKPFVADDVGH